MVALEAVLMLHVGLLIALSQLPRDKRGHRWFNYVLYIMVGSMLIAAVVYSIWEVQ